MLLGPTPAQSKLALCNWLDLIVTRAARDEARVFNLNGVRQHGVYHRLRQTEFGVILGLLSNLHQWETECSTATAPVSCGTFYMTIPGGRGGMTQQAIICGPFLS